MLRFSDIRMKPKLVFLFMMTGAFPLVLVGLLGTHLASEALIEQSLEQLSSIQHIKAAQIEDALREREDDLRVLADNMQLKQAVADFSARSQGVTAPAEHPMEARVYKALVNQHRSFWTSFLETHDYHDIYLVSPDGAILYSVNTESARGQSLVQGPLSDSGLATAFKRTAASPKPQFVDFEPFAPSHDLESAFLSVPVTGQDGALVAIVAAQMSPGTFGDLMRSREGLGKTGESYLVGRNPGEGDFEFRSALQTMGGGEYTIGRSFTPTQYWKDAFESGQESGHGRYVDSAGTPVLVAYTPLRLYGLDWSLISKVDKAEITAPARSLLSRLALGGLIVLGMVAAGSYHFTRRLVHPIRQDMDFAQAIADGDFDSRLDLDQKDELGKLAKTLNRMAESLHAIDWLQRGKHGLDDVMRGEGDPADLARRFISFFAKHFGAQLGAVYMRTDDSDTFALAAGYAFSDRKGNLQRFRMGEGLVGQAALEREVIVFSGLDEQEAPPINTGIEELAPSHVMLAPLEHDGSVLGVVLLGSVKPFTPLQRKLVEQNQESIAIHFHTASSRQVINELLEQAEEQAETLKQQREDLSRANKDLAEQAEALKTSESELQAQQEELRVTNEELEEQTKALRSSEEKLQSQQEELRVTNEELEERTKALEKQRSALRQKNIDLLRAQDVIEQKANDLEIASKYKSEFLANMSHELRTPLNSILILSQLLADNAASNLDEKQGESARAINSSGSDLLRLINEILDLSKVESGKVEVQAEELPVKRVVEDLTRVFAEIAADKGVPFKVDIADDAPHALHTDAMRLQQILRNLISNAFKFTDEGAVTLAVSRPGKEVDLTSSGLDPARTLAFAVTDTGIGIPEDKQAVIFEAFQQADGTTSRKYGGTGLGLSISRELARLLGGEMQLTSTPGEGSTFTLYLPETYEERDKALTADAARLQGRVARAQARAAARAAARKDARDEAPASGKAGDQDTTHTPAPPEANAPDDQDQEDGNGEDAASGGLESTDQILDDRKHVKKGDKSLLIVEDDPNFARILVDMGRDRGFKCLVAGDGETGLHFADYYRPSAIVLDVGLPGIDGWTVMDRLKTNPELRHIPVHFMSAADETLDALRMGAVGYLTKPVSLDAIKNALGRIEGVLDRPVKRLLVVEDDELQRDSIRKLIGNGDVDTVTVETGEEAYEMLESETFDCMILDLGLKDMSGFELLRRIKGDGVAGEVPIIVYTGRELKAEEEEELSRHAESIIIKGARSPERLLDETTLFLHRVEANLPEDKQRMLRMVHDKEALLADKKILLVDDDMRNVFALSSALESHGMEVTIARNGREGVEKLSSHPDTDLVLMDIMMPEMDGYEAMRTIRKRKRFRELPIIALTAKAMKGDRNKCIEAGASDYLAKPVDTDKLFSLLRVWLYK